MNLNLISALAVGLGVVGQALDGITTYVGLYVKKVAVEEDSSATWITKNKFLCLTFKPALVTVCGALLIYAGPYTNDGGNVMAIVGGAACFGMGLASAIGNAKINKGWF